MLLSTGGWFEFSVVDQSSQNRGLVTTFELNRLELHHLIEQNNQTIPIDSRLKYILSRFIKMRTP